MNEFNPNHMKITNSKANCSPTCLPVQHSKNKKTSQKNLAMRNYLAAKVTEQKYEKNVRDGRVYKYPTLDREQKQYLLQSKECPKRTKTI